MSDTISPSVLSSVETGYYGLEQEGGFILPPFWDAAMARYGLRASDGFLGISDNVELLMRHMMREPLIMVADRVLRALVCEGEHVINPAVQDEPKNKRSQEYKRWKRSQKAHEFTVGYAEKLRRPLKSRCWHLMESAGFGHKLCEIEVTARDGKVVPTDVSPKPRTAYQFKVDKSNRILGAKPTAGNGVDLVPPINLLVMTVGGMDDSPIGEPALAAAYKPWQRKEGDLKNQGMSSRQSGGGFLVIEEAYPPQGVQYMDTVKVKNAVTGEITEEPKGYVAAQEARNIVSGRVGKLPPGMTARLLQASGATVFDSAIDRADREMVMCFLGQARAILSSDSNSQADSGVAEGIALTMRDLYRGLLCDVIQGMFKDFILLNLGEEYADVIPTYDIVTEETTDITTIGNLLTGMFDRLSTDQKNYLASKLGMPEFAEDDVLEETEVMDLQDRNAVEEEVAEFVASFNLQGDLITFATRNEIANGAANRRIGGRYGVVRSADRQFANLVRRLVAGKIDEEEFRERFAYTIQVAHERAYGIGYKHGLGGDELSERGEEYVASTVASEGEYMNDLASLLASGEISEAEGLRRARLYANRVRGTANEAFREASLEGGYTLTWELGAVEDHCEECPRYASMSPWEPDELPVTPGTADTPCKANCKCRLTRSDGRDGFGPVDFA